MTTRAVWAILVLVFLLVLLLEFGVSGMYYAAGYSRTVKEREVLADSVIALNEQVAIMRSNPLVVACSYATRADLYDSAGNRLAFVTRGVVSGHLSPLADSIEVLNAKLADAEAQATERLKGWRSESRSTPMPDSSWTTTFTGARLSDLRRRSAESARRADSLLREPEGVR